MLHLIKKNIWNFVSVVALLFVSQLSAQDVVVKATMDSTAMLIGHQTKLTLELTKPLDADIAFPMVLDTLVDKVEVLSRSAIDTTMITPTRQHLSQELLVTSFDSGFYYIPPFEFEIQAQSGGGALKTNPLVLKMYTYQIDSLNAIFDIKPMKKIKFTFQEFLPYLMWWVIISLIILLGIAIYWRMKNKQPLFAPKPEPKEPPYIIAFRELERIRAEKLWQKGEIKVFYTEVTDTLRTYLEGRYDVIAMEQTSDEILADIKKLVEKEDFKKLEALLQLSDLVKFAKFQPMTDENERVIKDIYAFVDKTKRVFEDEESTEDADDEATEERKK